MNSKVPRDVNLGTITSTVLDTSELESDEGTKLGGLVITEEIPSVAGGVLTAAAIIGGIFIANGAITTTTAAALVTALAAIGRNIHEGEVLKVLVVNSTAGPLTITLGAGITSPTLAPAIAASSSRMVYIRKTAGINFVLY